MSKLTDEHKKALDEHPSPTTGEIYELEIYFGHIPEMKKYCFCEGWGCHYCCKSAAEIRGRQGIYG